MTDGDAESAPKPVVILAWILIAAGVLLLSFFTRTSGRSESESDEPKATQCRQCWRRFRSEIAERVSPILPRVLALALMAALLFGFLVGFREAFDYLVAIDELPAKQFPFEAKTAVIFGVIVSVTSNITSKLAKGTYRVLKNSIPVTKPLETPIFAVLRLSSLVIAVTFVTPTFLLFIFKSFTLVEAIRSPSVVTNVWDVSHWRPNHGDTISLVFSYVAAVVVVFYTPLAALIWRILSRGDSPLLGRQDSGSEQ